LRFDWDADKAAANRHKHGVTFEEAASVFNDPLARRFTDERHSQNEDREILIGESGRRRILIAFFVDREEVIRIISARRATARERRRYEQQ
jgi:uncharacterized DUF497 family protein